MTTAVRPYPLCSDCTYILTYLLKIRPIGFGEFEPVHRPRNEDLTPPPSARLPPIQTQAANQWSKNIWEYNNKGGSGFGAVARPKGVYRTRAHFRCRYADIVDRLRGQKIAQPSLTCW